MELTEFLLARFDEDEAAVRLEVGRRDVILTGPFAPARLLAECEAKRRIVEQAKVSGYLDHLVGQDVLRLLALPYADHPDYDPGWKP